MKSRFALTLVIASGLLMGTGGVTMAVTGSSGSGSAAQNEYAQPDKNQGSNLGKTDDGTPPATEQVKAASTDTGTLPFTGFAAIPLLVLGVGLLTVGVVLRLRLSRDQS